MSKKSVHERFKEIVTLPVEGQLEFFLKRYILLLGTDWQEVPKLASKFKKYTAERNDTSDLNIVEAADFLQKNGKTRTANERKQELKDIDLDNNGRIAFVEYLILHYKVLVLKDAYRETGTPIPKHIDFGNDGIGITGVGEVLLEGLFAGGGIDPEVEAAIEAVMQERKERDDQMTALKNTSKDTALSQVQRMKAHHELLKLEAEDRSKAEEELIHLLAARRRAKRNGSKAFDKSKADEEKALKEKAQASKNKLAALKNRFQEGAKVDDSKFRGNAGNRASVKAIARR